jgi:hypothetical protein
VIVVPDYGGHRIDIEAVSADDGRWNANVRIRRTLSDAKPHVETVTRYKVTARLAEERAEIRARRRIEINAEDG